MKREINIGGLVKIGEVANAEAFLANIVKHEQRVQTGVISAMLAGFVEETGLLPSQCILSQQTCPNGITLPVQTDNSCPFPGNERRFPPCRTAPYRPAK